MCSINNLSPLPPSRENTLRRCLTVKAGPAVLAASKRNDRETTNPSPIPSISLMPRRLTMASGPPPDSSNNPIIDRIFRALDRIVCGRRKRKWQKGGGFFELLRDGWDISAARPYGEVQMR